MCITDMVNNDHLFKSKCMDMHTGEQYKSVSCYKKYVPLKMHTFILCSIERQQYCIHVTKFKFRAFCFDFVSSVFGFNNGFVTQMESQSFCISFIVCFYFEHHCCCCCSAFLKTVIR